MYNLKNLGKRGLALFLSLVMCISMLNLTVFAAESSGTVEHNNTDWTFTGDGQVAHKKTIERVGENTFDITLNVKTKEEIKSQIASPDAAVVVVMDVSNSMAETVDGRDTKNDAERRITKAKAAAQSFIDSFAADAGDAQRQVAVVEFGSNAYTVQGWTEPATARSAVDNVAINFETPECRIEGTHTHDVNTIEWGPFHGLWRCTEKDCEYYHLLPILTLFDTGYKGHTHEKTYNGPHGKVSSDGGGTNIEAGLQLADNLLAQSSIEKKFVVLITDGVPTYHVYREHYTAGETSYIEGQKGGGNYAAESDYRNVPTVAKNIKSKGQLFTVSYASGTVSNKVDGKSIDAWLSSFATKNIAAGKDIDLGLENITTIIQNQAKAWLLTDPIPAPYIVYNPEENENIANAGENPDSVLNYKTDGTGTTLTWDLKSETGKKMTEGGETWYLYETTYRVHLDTAAEGFKEKSTDAEDKETGIYPTNGTTTLTYMLTVDGQLQEDLKSTNLDVPSVSGKVPTVRYTVKHLLLDRATGEYVERKEDTRTESGKLWSTVSVQAKNYSGYSLANVSGTGNKLLSEDNLVFEVKYDPQPVSVVVNQYVIASHSTDTGDYTTVKKMTTDTFDEYYAGDKFTFPTELMMTGCELVPTGKSVEVDGTTYTTDKYSDVKLNDAQTVINIYYTMSVEERTPVELTVEYHYRTNEWTLNNGKYELTEGEYVIDNSKTVASGEYFLNDPYAAPDLAGDYTLDEITFNGKKADSLTVCLDQDVNTMKVYYQKDAQTPESAKLTVVHKYYEMASTTGGYVLKYEDKEWDNQDVYVGETWTASDLSDAHDGGWTLKTAPADMSKTIEAGENTITVEYKRDSRVPAQIVVNHYYTTYEAFVNTETNEVDYRVIREDQSLNNVPEGTYYVGDKFTADKVTNGFTFVEGDDQETELTAGVNTFNLYYEAKVNDLAEADVTVYHHYKTIRHYVNDEGVLVEYEETEDGTATGETFEGVAGQTVDVELEETYKDNAYKAYRATGADTINMKATLVGEGGEVHIYYKRYVDDRGDAVQVKVQPVYKSYRIYVVPEIGREYTDLVNTDMPEASVLAGNWYNNQKASALSSDYARAGFTYDPADPENKPQITVNADGENVIVLVYKAVDDQREPVQVVVQDFYTTVTREIVNGVYTETPVTEDGEKRVIGSYKGMMFSTQGLETSREGFHLDENKDQPEPEIQLTANTTYVYFHWISDEAIDRTEHTNVTVEHQYRIVDANPNAEDIVWYEGANYSETYYVGQNFVAAPNFQGGIFNVSHITNVTPAGAIEGTGIVLADGENKIVIQYVKNIDTRVPTSVKVIHEYYASQAALDSGAQPATNEVSQTGYVGLPFTAEAVVNYQNRTYEVKTPAEDMTLVLSENAEQNVITIKYVRTETTYTVVHEYYTNGTLTGSTSSVVGGTAGAVVSAEDITKVTSYENNSYSFSAERSDAGITLVQGENGAITLRYYRTTGGGGGGTTSYYNLVINYVFEDGTEAAPTHSSRHASGYRYNVTSPEVEGFVPDQTVVVGVLSNGDVEITVTYSAEVEIPDENPPLIDGSEVDEELPEIEIPDEEPPLVEIPEEEVPLDGTPRTGDNRQTGLWLSLFGGSMFGLLALLGKKRKDEEA